MVSMTLKVSSTLNTYKLLKGKDDKNGQGKMTLYFTLSFFFFFSELVTNYSHRIEYYSNMILYFSSKSE